MKAVSLLLLLFALPLIAEAGRACTSSESRVIRWCSDANCNSATQYYYHNPVDECDRQYIWSCNSEGDELTVTVYDSHSDCTGNTGTTQTQIRTDLPSNFGSYADCQCQESATLGVHTIIQKSYTDSSCSTLCDGSNGCSGMDDLKMVGGYRHQVTSSTSDFGPSGTIVCSIYGLENENSRISLSTYVEECTSDSKVLMSVSTAPFGCNEEDEDDDGNVDYYILSELSALPTVAPTQVPSSDKAELTLTSLELSLLIVCVALFCMLIVSLWYQYYKYPYAVADQQVEHEIGTVTR